MRIAVLSGITYATAEPFYWLFRNLYVVRTPESGNKETTIEDLFPGSVLATKVDGREFDRGNDKDTTGEYGKSTFASRVVEPNAATFDFTGFAPLLNRIVAVINDYKGELSKPAAAAE